ncbi:hypothetical protein JTB14_013463 [Gonioctena quinquepunctata]|nr:hypothetical protein JTB14_013463 [Gonioctena quinquepunctata]
MNERYDFINAKIEMNENNNNKIILRYEIRNLAKYIKTAFKVMERANAIFGWQIFLFCINMAMRMLFNIFWIIFLDAVGLEAYYELFLYMAMMFLLIMPCDSLEESGKKIVRTCYKLHLADEEVQAKEQILLLSHYANFWRPSISSAGFFLINRCCLTKLFSSVITYIVVFVQFEMSMRGNNKTTSESS